MTWLYPLIIYIVFVSIVSFWLIKRTNKIFLREHIKEQERLLQFFKKLNEKK